MILLIDNYDSFVYNLARYVVELGCATRVVRNDALTVDDVAALRPRAVIISPGPRTPTEAGISIELIQRLGHVIPILGVCLGHQAIAQAWGGRIVRSPRPVHGKTSSVLHAGTGVFEGLPSPLRVARYHSLLVDLATLPRELEVIAWTAEDHLPMALVHRDRPVVGVQFHPESILTEGGHQLLANFLRLAGVACTLPTVGDLVVPPPADQSTATADWPPLFW